MTDEELIADARECIQIMREGGMFSTARSVFSQLTDRLEAFTQPSGKVSDDPLIRLSDQDRQYLRMIVPGIEQRSREPGDAWNEAAALLWLLIDTADPIEAAQLSALEGEGHE